MSRKLLADLNAKLYLLAYEAYKQGQMHALDHGSKHAIGYGFDAWWDHLYIYHITDSEETN